MAQATKIPAHGAEASRVLTEAVARIADLWRLSNARLGAIIGLSAPTASRLRAGSYRLEAGSKPFELSQHLLRLFRSLDSWLGQDDEAVCSWLATVNLDLGERPIELLPTVRGLLRTSDYVDALRARV
ncbi:MbcA/ParS/Xre antitoxin family protein [Sphingomonas sp. MG17]|uniref:MbcA/ParS/Xre antitoxin family protein n=1 Tax=Sphingomonas tagetis TaxID=2949092 RepID=A0A9X2KMT3_9SPHN|nr:antitoxin Xre-like helix-turn-helix domain-containing protein [Sphingomonas tagetis]MCP3731801.1 MbcA/ParS/Xre antitoxin family protein [Sphingomonas tagetis]